MLIRSLTGSFLRPNLFMSKVLYKHTKICPSGKKSKSGDKGPCSSKCGDGSGKDDGAVKRAERSGKCRIGFVPEEWFTFFYPKTGVSGPYLFGLMLGNYLVSKEIFIMEHEYYLGLSAIVVLVYVTKNLGPSIGESLDKEVDSIVTSWQKGRNDDIAECENTIKMNKKAQWQAEGQKVLMDAKKENILMQLEAAYRERSMMVYKTVKGRMDYHVKRHRAEARIHQKWMIGWILDNVMKSITPEFEKQALNSAISDLAAAASRA